MAIEGLCVLADCGGLRRAEAEADEIVDVEADQIGESRHADLHQCLLHLREVHVSQEGRKLARRHRPAKGKAHGGTRKK